MRASADLANGAITDAMPANNTATPAITSARAVNAKISERAVAATAMPATLSMTSPAAIQMIRAALRRRAMRLAKSYLVPDLPQPLGVYGWHSALVKHLAGRSAQDAHSLP